MGREALPVCRSPADRGDPSSVLLRKPPSPARGEGNRQPGTNSPASPFVPVGPGDAVSRVSSHLLIFLNIQSLRGKQPETGVVLPHRSMDLTAQVGAIAAGVRDPRRTETVGLSPYLQHTLGAPAVFAGVGIHTGAHVRVAVRPAAAGAGITFIRVDVDDLDRVVPARAETVCNTRLGTVIGNADGVTVSTVEHLMAAFCALR